MKLERIAQILDAVRYPVRIQTTDGRTYRVDRPAGVSLQPDGLVVARDGYDVLIEARDVEFVEGRKG
jgi:hypothetical protein